MTGPFIVKNAAKAAAGATAAIKLSDKAAKAFAGATKSIENSFETGALQSFENAMTNIQSSGPIMALMQYITAQIAAGTMDSTMELFRSSMEALRSDAGQAGMGLLNVFLTNIVDNITGITDLFNAAAGGGPALANAINALTSLFSLLNEFSLVGSLNLIIEAFQLLNGTAEEMSESMENVMAFFESIRQFLTPQDSGGDSNSYWGSGEDAYYGG